MDGVVEGGEVDRGVREYWGRVGGEEGGGGGLGGGLGEGMNSFCEGKGGGGEVGWGGGSFWGEGVVSYGKGW